MAVGAEQAGQAVGVLGTARKSRLVVAGSTVGIAEPGMRPSERLAAADGKAGVVVVTCGAVLTIIV